MTVELPPELQQLVEEQVKTGAFPTSAAAVEAAIRHAFAEQSADELAELRALIDEGIADIEAGRIVEDFKLNDFLAECRKDFQARQGS